VIRQFELMFCPPVTNHVAVDFMNHLVAFDLVHDRPIE